MVELKTIATGSSGNSYALIAGKEILLLDVGVSAKEIKQAIDFRVSDVSACLVTHKHLDHSKSVKDFEYMGIPVYKPYEEKNPISLRKGSKFTVKAFDLTDLKGNFKHTNADGSECPCYGFFISHPDMGKMVYITDAEFVKWRFRDINHILISCDYQKKYITEENESKRNHVLRGHMELETVKGMVLSCKSPCLRTVILCHMSASNSNPIECAAELKKIAGEGVDVQCAQAGMDIELMGE